MIAATWPRDAVRLVDVDPAIGVIGEGPLAALASRLRAGDVLVMNDAATLPASLHGQTARGEPIELRLAGAPVGAAWDAVLFGAGDWRTPTEHRAAPPHVRVGDVLLFGALPATVTAVDDASPRRVRVVFAASGGELWRALYRAGAPVQYAYTAGPLALWHVQTACAARPWAAEPPSAGLALTWELLLALRRSGVTLARVTHAAGLSSTGDETLDRRLPLPERYEIPPETVEAIAQARRRGGRIVAVGTTTTRALEGAAAANGGALVPGTGMTDLRLGPDTRRHVVDGILTGLHEPGTSHAALLEAFAARAVIERAHALAEERDLQGHEFGDVMLILPAHARRHGHRRRVRGTLPTVRAALSSSGSSRT